MGQRVGYGGAVAIAALAGLLAGCRPSLDSLAPRGFTPADPAVVRAWIAEMSPRGPRLYHVRPWRYRNENGAAAGRANVRVAPPDSLRFDYRGPFGKSGNAVVVRDSTLWASGEGLGALTTFAPVLWAALGIPQPPDDSVRLFSLTRRGVRAWRYLAAGDTLDFVLFGSPARRLEAELRRAGQVLTQARVELDPATGWTRQAQIDFWDVSRFEFTVTSVDTSVSFDASVWQAQ